MMNFTTMNFSPSECCLFSENGGKDPSGNFDIVNTPSLTFYAKLFKWINFLVELPPENESLF